MSLTASSTGFLTSTGFCIRRAVYPALAASALVFSSTASAQKPIDCSNATANSSDEVLDYCAIHVEATTAIISGDEESSFTGNVQLRSQGQRVSADELSYDPRSEAIKAFGGVHFETNGADIEADSAEVSLGASQQQQSATFNNARFRIEQADPPASGKAEKIELSAGQQTLNGVHYTTCDANEPDWELRADSITINGDSGQGLADDVTLRVKGIPVFYLPKLPFPASNKRSSGFLPPVFDSSASKGSELRLPWYWNIAPNYDATISPSFMSDRGLATLGEFRYLTAGLHENDLAESSVSGLWLFEDKATHDQRYHLSWQHQQRWGHDADQWLALSTDINHVSDAEYFFDFDNNQQARQTHLSSYASIVARQREANWQQTLSIGAQRHKTLAQDSAQALPAIRYELGGVLGQGWSWSVTPEWAELESPATQQHYQRGTANTEIRWEQQAEVINTEFSAGYRYHQEKDLNSQDKRDIHLPFASLQIGTGAEKQFAGFNHHIELTTAYHYADYQDQTAFNQIDSSQNPALWDDLWLNNRFSGQDRYSDSNDISWGFTNRFTTSNGEELARFDIGQRIALGTPKAISNNNQQWVGRAQARLSKRLSVYGDGLYDAESGLWQQANVDVRYQPSRHISAYGRWSRPTDLSEQFTLASQYENNSINVSAQWTRDIENHRSLGGEVAVAYKACCWSLGLSMRRSTSADPTEAERMTTSWGLQFELRGLGGISQSAVSESYSVRRWLY